MRSVRFGTCCSPHQFSISQSVGHGLDNKSVVAKLVLQQTVLMYQHPLHLCVHHYKQAAALVLPQNLTVCRLLLRLLPLINEAPRQSAPIPRAAVAGAPLAAPQVSAMPAAVATPPADAMDSDDGASVAVWRGLQERADTAEEVRQALINIAAEDRAAEEASASSAAANDGENPVVRRASATAAPQQCTATAEARGNSKVFGTSELVAELLAAAAAAGVRRGALQRENEEDEQRSDRRRIEDRSPIRMRIGTQGVP